MPLCHLRVHRTSIPGRAVLGADGNAQSVGNVRFVYEDAD